MLAVKNGQTEKLTFIYERHKKRFFNYFVKMTLDYDSSQDLLQNFFIRILKYRKSYKRSQPFLPWSYRVARNMAYDESKKKQLGATSIEIEKVSDRLIAPVSDETVIEREQQLMRAIARLPQDKRELIIWTKIDGMKYVEVANIKDTSVGAIKVQVHRAMSQLKNIYFESNGEIM